MSSHRKEILKLSEHGVITGQAMIAYLRNELNTEERQEMEKLLQEDPFARDAMEGLQGAPGKSTLASSLVSVNRKVRERSGLKENKQFKLHWSIYAWAATILGLLIAIGYVLVYVLGQNETRMVAQNNKNAVQEQKSTAIIPPNTQALPAGDTTRTNVQPGNPVTVNNSTGSTQAPPGLTTTITNSTLSASGTASGAVSTNNARVANGFAPAASMAPAALPGKTNVIVSASSQKNMMSPGANRTANMEYKNVATLRSTDSIAAVNGLKPKSVSLDGAMQSFYAGDYKTAAGAFDAVLKNEPDNPQALYFGAISDYINGETAKSEISFDKILKKGTIFIDGAKWYKANILLKKGERDQAKSLLQDLSNSNGSYKERAVKKLADLGF